MIYSINVSADPLPEGGWGENITVEVDAKSNPEIIHVLGPDWKAVYVLEGPADWCISALTHLVHTSVSEAMEAKVFKNPG